MGNDFSAVNQENNIASLALDKDGTPVLRFNGPDGPLNASLTLSDDGPQLVLADQDGKIRALVTVSQEKNKDPKAKRNGTRDTQTAVRVADTEAGIDERVVAIICALDKAGIEANASDLVSTWGTEGILFENIESAKQFLDIVGHFEVGAGTVYHRIRGPVRPYDAEKSTPWWHYDLYPDDHSIHGYFDEHGKFVEFDDIDSRFIFRVAIHVPPSDYDVVLARLREHNKRRQEGTFRTNSASGTEPSSAGTDKKADPSL